MIDIDLLGSNGLAFFPQPGVHRNINKHFFFALFLIVHRYDRASSAGNGAQCPVVLGHSLVVSLKREQVAIRCKDNTTHGTRSCSGGRRLGSSPFPPAASHLSQYPMRAVLRPPDIAQTVMTPFAADHIEGVLEANTGVASSGAPLRLVRYQAPFPAAILSEDRRAPKAHTFVVTARGEDTDSSRNAFRTTDQAPS